jgi:hypothetical protein
MTGWEHGVTPDGSNGTGSGLYLSGTYGLDGGTISVASDIKRTGGFALKVANAGAGTLTRLAYSHGTAGSGHSVGRIYVYFETLPSAAAGVYVKFMQVGINDAVKHGTWEVDSAGTLRVSISSVAYQTWSGTIVTGQWYQFDWHFDSSATTYTHEWRVDRVVQTPVTRASMTADTTTGHSCYPSCQSDTNAHNVGSFRFDDMALSTTAADFPLPGGRVIGITVDQSAAAEHQSITLTQWQYTDDFSSFTNFASSSETDSRSRINDLSYTTGIRLNGGASGQAGNARWSLADPSPDPNVTVNWMRGIVAGRDPTGGAGTNNLLVRILIGASTTNILNADPGGAANTWVGAMIGNPLGNIPFTPQNVRDMKIEIDSSDSNPAVWVGGVFIEIDYQYASEQPYAFHRRMAHLLNR